MVTTLGGYVRGTAAVAAFDAVAIAPDWRSWASPLTIPLAVVAFVTSFIPMIGAPVAGTLAPLVTLVGVGPVQAVVVVAPSSCS